MSSMSCNSYVCRMISRKLRRNMQVTSLPVAEPKRGKAAGEPPELQTVGIGWPSLVAPDIIVYNQNQQAKTGEPPPPAPSIMLTPPRGAPWHLSGIADSGIAVNKLKYLAATDFSDAGEPTKHVHEHHHYDCTHKSRDGDLPMVVRNGYMLIKAADLKEESPPAPPLHNPHCYINGMFVPRNRRFSDNGSIVYPQYTAFLNCPFYRNPNAMYPQNQRFAYSNGPVIGQHHHFHQHFYHSQYQYQQMNYQHSQQFRFMPHQQPRMQFNPHSHHHYRPYFEHNDAQVWPEQAEYNGRAIVKLY